MKPYQICAVSVKNAVNVHIFLSKGLQVSSASITFNCRTFYNMIVSVFADSNAFQIFKAFHFQVLWLAIFVLGKSSNDLHLFGSSATFFTPCRCSDISIIKLDSSRKHILVLSFCHCIAKPLEYKPSGFVW